MAPKLAAFGDQITQNEKLFRASPRSTTRARPRDSRPSSSASPGSTTRTSSARARSSTRRPRRGCRRSTSGSPRSTRTSARTSSPTRATSCWCSRTRPTSPACRSRTCRGRGRRGGARPEGQVGDHQHALEHRAVPHLLGPPRPAREGVAHVRQPRRQRRRARQQRDHHRDPQAPRRAREAPRLRDARALAAREHDGAKPRARDGADGGGVDAGGRARARGSRRHAGDRRQGEGRHHDRALGLPLLRGEGPQGEVRPRRERGQALPAAREAARRHVLGGRRALRLQLHARGPCEGAGLPPRRARLGGERRRGQARRPLVLRSLRAPGQALGRLDERLPHAGAVRRRDHDDRLEQLELREGQAGRAGADQLGRRDDALPRVRPRAARPELERDLSRRCRAPRSRATTSSSRRSCSSTGSRRPRC